MHVLYFGLKRAFQATLKVNRPLLDRHGITPARFDLLYCIHQTRLDKVRQSTVRKALGVARPTVSRMVGSLVELGLLERGVDYDDARQKRLALSVAGRKIVRRVLRKFMQSDVVDRCVRRAFSYPNAPPSRRRTNIGLIERLDDTLERFRRCFGDFATLEYPWHPDD
ncbi:MAG TPA: MarR family winged helix-turn-helix transcriptional regulator [Polyangiaceae bacterium]